LNGSAIRRRIRGALLILFTAAAAMALSARAGEPAPPAPQALSTEYAVNPVGIDESKPRLAWKLRFPERGAVQRAYQIQAAPTPEQLEAQRGLLWDSGRVDSDQSTQLAWAGPALRSGQRVAWRVRAWNGAGAASGWSAPAWFETGLLDRTDWHARWITADPAANPAAKPGSASPAAMLRKGFALPRKAVQARLYITSLGMYEARINGVAVTDQVLRPGWTSYDKRLQYQVYDVTAFLHRGDNAIGVTLGDGWYRGSVGWSGRGNYGTQRALLAELRVTLDDGSSLDIGSDGSWKATTGPILMSDLQQGETYDARLERAGWADAGHDDSGWRAVQVLERPTDRLVAQNGPGVRRIMEVKPAKILHTPQGETVFDFGQNLVGWVRLRVRGAAGTTVRLRHAEVLDKAGNFYTANLRKAAQTVSYTLKGGAEEVYEPHFSFQGFRYVAVDGYPGAPGEDALRAVVVHTDLGPANSWTSSHPLLNQLVKNTIWGQRGNFVDVPTDCPQRDERLGWTADVQVFARTAAYNFDVAAFYTKWMADLAADQKPDGSVPIVIPDAIDRAKSRVDGAAGWSDAVTVVPSAMYRAYGDRRLLETRYAAMKAWVDHVARVAPDGLWNRGPQFGDWLAYQAPSSEARAYPGATTGQDLVATAYFVHSAELLADAARVLGRPEDAHRYANLAEKGRLAFNREFVSAAGRVGENTQTAYALALRFDLLPPALREQAARRLAAEVKARKDHLTTGFLGTPALLFALSEHGQLDTAYKLLLQDSYPSWLYPIRMGATTIWERWDGIKPDGSFQDPAMNSFNHYAYGAVVEWMYAVVAGIDSDPAAPGYKRSIIRPRPGGGLRFVRAKVETPYGELASGWELEADGLRVTVKVPPNTRSRVVLPAAVAARVTLDGKPLAASGLAGVQEGADLALDVGAGSYEFAVKRNE
jgi:alpha-L-rhamnosidase